MYVCVDGYAPLWHLYLPCSHLSLSLISYIYTYATLLSAAVGGHRRETREVAVHSSGRSGAAHAEHAQTQTVMIREMAM